MFKLIPAALVVTVAAAAPALAQDAGTFTGARVEGNVGWSELRFDLGALGGTGRRAVNGLTYGGAIGYDAALTPKLVAGVEAGLNFSDGATARGSTINGGSLRERREITLAGRIGTPITANALLYGKLGYANLEVREDHTVAGVTTSTRPDLDGVLLGTGLEVKLSPRAYIKSEYTHTDYAADFAANKVVTGFGLRF